MAGLDLGKQHVKNVAPDQFYIENRTQTYLLIVIIGIGLVYVHIW